MAAPKGNKFATGGARPGAGRPTKQEAAAKKQAAEILKAIIERNINLIGETYVALAAGRVVKRMTEDGEKEFYLDVDRQTNRDAVAKFLANAKQEIDVSLGVRITKADDELASNVHWRKAKDVTPSELEVSSEDE